jgi:hypothetical protein
LAAAFSRRTSRRLDRRIDILLKTCPGKKDFYTMSLTNIHESETSMKIKIFI